MPREIRIASPPAKPLLIFDGECRFCRLWIKRWQQITGDQIDYLPFQDASIAEKFPEIPLHIFAKSVQLIEPDGSVYCGAEAALRALACNPRQRWPFHLYQNISAFASITEWFYAVVARHRTFFSSLTRLGWGEHTEAPTHFLVRSLFLRSLAIIYFVAFLSLWTQVSGLIGSSGILPAAETMRSVQQQVEQRGIGFDRFRLFPTLCWFNSGDSFLQVQCAAGAAIALFTFFGIAPALCLALVWILYLSLTTISADFLSFQWDNLLLEAGFLAIFFAPWQLLPKSARASPPSRLVLWLLRWLIFRLMFESGVVKILSGDLTWRNLTALDFHYETQPLPTWLGYYAHHLPETFQKFSLLLMFLIEIVVPFLIFGPRRFRSFAAACFIVLQLLIALTGNYGFFNLLTVALCLPLLDDFTLRSWIPARWQTHFASTHHVSRFTFHRVRIVLSVLLVVVILPVTLLQLTAMFRPSVSAPVISSFHQWLSPFRSTNRYGLFAVMTTSHPEIIIEGSNDGQTWLAYEFKSKPGDLKGRPEFVAPHQPRLDWQMWFAALGNYRQNPWFIQFCIRLLQGSPEVLALLEKNPFPEKPPHQIRAVLYYYHFTDADTRHRTGEWWRRERKDLYCPVLQLK